MAYSNFGAYAYKNGENVTKTFCDKSFYYDKNKNEWTENTIVENSNGVKHVYSHATIPLNKTYLLEFYKTHIVNIYIKDKQIIKLDVQKDILDKIEYEYKGIIISAYYLDSEKTIIVYDIKYKKDVYTVVVGSAFGNGYDKRKTSKFVKNHMYYDYYDRYFYISRFKKNYVDVSKVIDNYRRKEEIIDEIKSIRWCTNFKNFLEKILNIWYLL